MKTWPTKTLGELCGVVAGGTPSRARTDFFDGEIPWVKISDMLQGTVTETEEKITQLGLENSAAKLLPVGTVLISIFATIGRTAVLGIEAATNQAIAGVTPIDPREITPAFLRFFLDHSVATLVNQSRGVAQLNINGKILKSLPIPVPPLPEQDRIVKLLDTADKLRELRLHADRHTAALIPAIFHEMFGDPAKNPLRLPLVRLGELCSFAPNYGTMIPARANGGEWLTLRVANIQGDALDLTSKKYVALPDDALERHTVLDGDLLLARAIGSEDHLGKCIVAYPGQEKWAFDSHLMRVRFNRKRCEPEWVKALLESSGGRQLFLNNTRKSAVQFNINSKEFGNITVPLPDLISQQNFLRRMTEIRALEASQAVSRTHLNALFQSMLHRAFNGEL